jgi:hypothetical protein
MKEVITILMITLSTFGNSHKVLLESITLKGFQYDIYRETLYSHDDNWNAEYFTIYLKGKNNRLCSSYLLAKRNDTTFIKGNYTLYKDKIEFTQHYYHNMNRIAIDSMKTVFYPDKNGKLLRSETKEFKDGKMKLSR